MMQQQRRNLKTGGVETRVRRRCIEWKTKVQAKEPTPITEKMTE
jgi:hypothetical protein